MGMTHAEVDAHDVAEVEHLLRRGGTPSRIETGPRGPDGADGRFAFAADVRTDGELTLIRYRCGGDWTLHAESDLFTVTSATTRTPLWDRQGERGDFLAAPVLLPPGRATAVIDGSTDVFEVRFTACAVARIAADLQGVEQVRLGDGLRTPRSPKHARYWAEVLRYTRRLSEGGLLADDRLVAALKTNLVASMLSGFALVEEAREWRLTPAGAEADFRRARAAVEGAARTSTAADVARTAGLPLRALDRLFRMQTGDGVEAALRAARVRGARSQLLRSEPSADAAEAVVRRWGFPSMAAFLPLHRAVVGRRALPFETGPSS